MNDSFNMTLGECVIVYKDNNGNDHIISSDITTLLQDWWGDCEYCCENDALIMHASIFWV